MLFHGAAADNLDGQGGIDTASYANHGSAVTATLTGSGMGSGFDGIDTDNFTGIENLTGSAYDDTLTGDSSNNVLTGGAGDDTISGGAGDDIIYAEEGSDSVLGEADNDTIHLSSDLANLPSSIDGGTGTDVIELEGLGATYDFSDLAGVDARLENIENKSQ